MRVELAGPIDVRDFRARANALLARQVAPAEIDWQPGTEPECSVAFRGDGTPVGLPPSALHSIVPRSFVRLTELVVLHRDPQRFALLYRLLWRMVHEPELAGSRGDEDLLLAKAMAQAVRRDLVHARDTTRLRRLQPQDACELSLAWCAPHHRITEHVAEWLATKQPAPPWLLASPDRCVLWTGRHLLCGTGLSPPQSARFGDRDWHGLAAQLARSGA